MNISNFQKTERDVVSLRRAAETGNLDAVKKILEDRRIVVCVQGATDKILIGERREELSTEAFARYVRKAILVYQLSAPYLKKIKELDTPPREEGFLISIAVQRDMMRKQLDKQELKVLDSRGKKEFFNTTTPIAKIGKLDTPLTTNPTIATTTFQPSIGQVTKKPVTSTTEGDVEQVEATYTREPSSYEKRQELANLLTQKVFFPLAEKLKNPKNPSGEEMTERSYYHSWNYYSRQKDFPLGGCKGFGVLSHGAECVLLLSPEHEELIRTWKEMLKPEANC